MNLTPSLALTSPTKRKAITFDDDAENVDPILFLSPKKSKTGIDCSSNDVAKPINYFLTKAPPSPNEFSSALKPVASPIRRPVLPARSPAPRINTASISKPSPLSAPAGRSPTRKRIGILNRRRTASPFTRIDPPKFSSKTASGLGFSIDAALSGTIPSYKPRAPLAAAEPDLSSIPLLHTPAPRDGWFFEIHEDTEEELATNLMEHGACTLDISSDEESARQERSDRGKENVPPSDDVSQTSTQPITAEPSMSSQKQRLRGDIDACEVDRAPLGEMAATDFYAEGCDSDSVILIPADADIIDDEQEEEPIVPSFDFSAEITEPEVGCVVDTADVDELMRKDDHESTLR